jgi:hypothetical protein
MSNYDYCPLDVNFLNIMGKIVPRYEELKRMSGGGDDEYTTKQKAIGHVMTLIAIGAVYGLSVGAIVSTIWYFGYSHVISDAYKVYELGMTGCDTVFQKTTRAVGSWLTGAPSCGEIQVMYDQTVKVMMSTLQKITAGVLAAEGAVALSWKSQYWIIYNYFMKKMFGECEIHNENEEREDRRRVKTKKTQKGGKKKSKRYCENCQNCKYCKEECPFCP